MNYLTDKSKKDVKVGMYKAYLANNPLKSKTPLTAGVNPQALPKSSSGFGFSLPLLLLSALAAGYFFTRKKGSK